VPCGKLSPSTNCQITCYEVFKILYFGQQGEVTGQGRNSRTVQSNAGVRQGEVFSPKMLSSVLHWAMSKWRTCAEGCPLGFDFGNDSPILDLGFANDILIFARSSRGIMTLLDKLIQLLDDAGAKLNLEKLY